MIEDRLRAFEVRPAPKALRGRVLSACAREAERQRPWGRWYLTAAATVLLTLYAANWWIEADLARRRYGPGGPQSARLLKASERPSWPPSLVERPFGAALVYLSLARTRDNDLRDTMSALRAQRDHLKEAQH